MKKLKNLYELIVREEIHKEMAEIFVIVLFVVVGGILSSQRSWTAWERALYYTHSGAVYDFWYIVLVPTFFALGWGVVAVALFLSSSDGSTTTKGR